MARRFGWASLVALGVLIVTGAWMASDYDLWDAGTLHAKLALVVVAGALILWHLRNGAAHWLQGADLPRVARDRLARPSARALGRAR